MNSKYFKLISLFLIVFASTSKALEIKQSELIKEICIIGFQSEMKLANKIAPKEMSDFTCNCFLNQVSLGYSIDLAKETCKEKASKKI